MTARRLASALAIPLAGLAVGAGAATAHLLTEPASCVAATYTSHVTLVVEHGDGRVVGLCIGFDGSSITGEQILAASGLEYATAGYGSLGDAVCQIDSEPAAYAECLPSGGSYWAVFVSRSGDPWVEAAAGVSTEAFASGDAEGFRYDPESGADPPPASPEGICAAALGGEPARPGGSPAAPSAQPERPVPTSTATPPPGAAVTPSPPATGTAPPGTIATPGATAPAAAISPHAVTTSAPPVRARPGPGPNPGLLVAAALCGGLVGLAAVQAMLRRRRG